MWLRDGPLDASAVVSIVWDSGVLRFELKVELSTRGSSVCSVCPLTEFGLAEGIAARVHGRVSASAPAQVPAFAHILLLSCIPQVPQSAHGDQPENAKC